MDGCHRGNARSSRIPLAPKDRQGRGYAPALSQCVLFIAYCYSMNAPDAQQVHKDHLYAFSCALNLLLYVADPGPDATGIGGPGETRSVSRREWLADLYARMLLLEVKGDIARLTGVASEARARCKEGDQEAENAAAELAEIAMRIICEAGADREPKGPPATTGGHGLSAVPRHFRHVPRQPRSSRPARFDDYRARPGRE
jgi:hypothetical protein